VLDPHNSDNVNEKGKTALDKYSNRKDGESALSKVSSTNRSTGDGKDSETSGSHGLEPSGRDDSTHSKRRREDSSEHTHDVKRFKMEDKHHDRSLDIEVASAARPSRSERSDMRLIERWNTHDESRLQTRAMVVRVKETGMIGKDGKVLTIVRGTGDKFAKARMHTE
ncbi:MAG: hypothetical protein Q9177_006993, partial [Variospora cf. flavescens]